MLSKFIHPTAFRSDFGAVATLELIGADFSIFMLLANTMLIAKNTVIIFFHN